MNRVEKSFLIMIVAYCCMQSGCSSVRKKQNYSELLVASRASDSSALLLEIDGKKCISEYAVDETTLLPLASVTKTISALAIAILVDQKKISSFDEPMTTWIPEWKNDPKKSQITLRMILSHTSGLPDEMNHNSDTLKKLPVISEFFYNDDLGKTATLTRLVYDPGTQFVYSSIGASLLEKVIRLSSGKPPSLFLSENLFQKLGIKRYDWQKDRSGREVTSGGLSLRAEDLLLIGRLILQGGKWNGETIISDKSLQALTNRSQTHSNYGLMFWRYDRFPGMVAARGFGGQFLLVDFDKKIVAVRLRTYKGVTASPTEAQKFRDFPEFLRRLSSIQ